MDVYVYEQQPGAARPSAGIAWPPALRRGMLSPPPRLGIADLHAYAEHERQRVVVTFAQEALLEGLLRFRDLFAVSPIGAAVTASPGKIGELGEYLSKQLALECLVHGSCFIASDAITLILHLEYLTRRDLVWASRVKIDPKDLDSIARTITNQCVIPIGLHLR